MVRKNAAIVLIGVIGCILLVACRSDQEITGPLRPGTTTTSTLMAVPTATATITPEPPTPTPYTPISKGTPLPPVYEPITANSASSVTLLASWEVGFQEDTSLVISADSNLVRMGLRHWRLLDGTLQSIPTPVSSEGHPTGLPIGGYSMDRRFFARINDGGDLIIIRPEDPTTQLYYYLEASQVYFFPDGRTLMVTFLDGEIWFIDFWMMERQLLALEPDHTYYDDNLQPDLVTDIGVKSSPTCVTVSADGSRMAFALRDGRIQIWQVADLSLLTTLNNPEQPTALAFSYDNNILAAASTDRLIRLWDHQSGKLLAELVGSLEPIKGLAFAPDGRILASASFSWIYLWGILPSTNIEYAQSTATALAQLQPSATHTPASLPLPSPTPTVSLPRYESLLPFAWPVPMPSTQQIEAARACDVGDLASQRYPAGLPYWKLNSAYTPESACDWAVLAAAYIVHTEDEDLIPEEGKRAFVQAILLNPALAFNEALFYPYFASFDLVETPPFTDQPITSLVIDYQWGGIGEPQHVEYQIEITQAHQEEAIQVSIQGQPEELVIQATGTLSSTLVQSVSAALVDFLPVQSPAELVVCTDNDPQWLVTITFLDGTHLTLETTHSNILNRGGPWYTLIEGQHYLQYSVALPRTMREIFESLNLEFGTAYSMYCYTLDPFSLVYP